MSTEDKKTDNELIAEFMGFPLTKNRVLMSGGMETVPFHRWDFDSNWSSLMPVVEKIRKVVLPELHKNIPPNSATHGDMIDVDISCGFMEVSISIVYKHVVEFIRWYNTQPK